MIEAITSLDAQILFFIQDNLRSPLATTLVSFWTNLGNAGIIWIVSAVLMLFFKKTRRIGVLALAGLIINFIVVNVTLKPLIGRPRPWVLIDGWIPLVYSDDPSFPSGHTSAAFAFAAAACCELDRKWVKALVWSAATLMGLSRLYVGVHFPSDVVGGIIFGSLCGFFAVWLYRKFFEKRFPLS